MQELTAYILDLTAVTPVPALEVKFPAVRLVCSRSVHCPLAGYFNILPAHLVPRRLSASPLHQALGLTPHSVSLVSTFQSKQLPVRSVLPFHPAFHLHLQLLSTFLLPPASAVHLLRARSPTTMDPILLSSIGKLSCPCLREISKNKILLPIFGCLVEPNKIVIQLARQSLSVAQAAKFAQHDVG